MKLRIIGATLALVFCIPLLASAQELYTEGPVSRVILLAVKPGKMTQFMAGLSKNKPIFEEAKRQGAISDYKIYLNTTKVGAEDFDVVITFQYPNMAALDGANAKMTAISLKHFGSQAAWQAELEQRAERAVLVASRLTREIMLK
ncbi:MAG: hypothetical protein ACREQB_07605 [Candidatus Binataceae bacterium]